MRKQRLAAVSGWYVLMDEDKLSQDIEKALNLVKDLPDEYRLRTYEILLSAFMKDRTTKAIVVEDSRLTSPREASTEDFLVPIDVKAFLVQNNLTEDVLWKLFLVEGSEVRPVYKLKTEKKATAVIQVACLLALENALMGKEFEFSIEDVRTHVQNLDLYDSTNFMGVFKKSKNKTLFTSLDDEEHVPISPAGKTELADIIEELIK